MLLDARLPGSDISYRATVEPWVGLPLYPPDGAARTQNGRTTVYASWNGATELASWRVLGVSSGGTTSTLASAPKSGFETAIPATHGYTRFEVQAVNSAGRVIGTSQPFSATG
jgi:hypothetical protein